LPPPPTNPRASLQAKHLILLQVKSPSLAHWEQAQGAKILCPMAQNALWMFPVVISSK
uniref:Uncharacterized protein n=1 Tax=Taeniopygia guttata TaxID=59729 RepID=A0A674G9A2_TAEGU